MTDLPLTKTAETATTITFGWTPVGDRGYRFTREKANGKWSNTWDPTRRTATFSKDSAWYVVEALGLAAAGKYPADAPPPPSAWPYYQVLGICDGSDTSQHTLDMVKALGKQVPVRLDLYAMGPYAKPFDLCIAQDIPILGTMCGTLKPGSVGQDTIGNPSDWPASAKRDTPEWCGLAADHYKGHVPVWELCNEPDGQGWQPLAYASYYADCMAQIRSADPGAKLCTGGIFRSEAGVSMTDFARAIVSELNRRNRPDLMDYFAVHPYDNMEPPWFTNIRNQWQMTFPLGADHDDHGPAHRAAGDTVREILDHNGFAHVPIVSTEYGTRFPSTDQYFADENKKKQDMVKPGYLAAGFIFRLDGTRNGFPDCTITKADGSPKLAYTAFKNALKP